VYVEDPLITRLRIVLESIPVNRREAFVKMLEDLVKFFATLGE